MSNTVTVRLGTRSSALAQWQANWVASQLRAQGVAVEIIPIRTEGDVKSGPLEEIGGQGLFTKEIQRALLDERIDLAVHSLKDLPTEPVEGLVLAASPTRESPDDAFLSRTVNDLASLPREARVGTGSPRRRAQLLYARPDLKVADVRGNVETRIKKLDEGEYDALILAEAGLRRLKLGDRITQIVPHHWMLPAVGQGALGLEIRQSDDVTRQAVEQLNDPATLSAVLAERSLLRTLRGGCMAPVGAWARLEKKAELTIDAVVLSGDGSEKVSIRQSAPSSQPETLGAAAAEKLLAQGAAALIAAAH